MIIGQSLGIGHHVTQHVAYVGSWIKALEDDPMEIFRAASDAEKIQEYVLSLAQMLTQKQTLEKARPVVIEKPLEIGKVTTEITWLNISYQEKDKVRELVGRNEEGRYHIGWDKAQKSWYANPGVDLETIRPWIRGAITERQEVKLTAQQDFMASLKALGFIITDGHPFMDGQKHRMEVVGDKKGEKSGFYIAHSDGHPAGYIKNHRRSEELRWKSKNQTSDNVDKAIIQASLQEKLKVREIENASLQKEKASQIQQKLNTFEPILESTPYLKTKEVNPHQGIYTDKSQQLTVVPAMDENGKIWTMQTIYPNGTKRFAKGAKKEGCFHVIGGFERLSKVPVIVIAEGYATAATAAQSLQFSMVSAFDAGNLKVVAKALHQKYPDKPIVRLGDDDSYQEAISGKNPGKEKAIEAATAVNGAALFPVFRAGEQTNSPKQFSDFNDLLVRSSGKEGIERQVNRPIEKIIQETRTHQKEQRPILEHLARIWSVTVSGMKRYFKLKLELIFSKWISNNSFIELRIATYDSFFVSLMMKMNFI